MKLSKKLIGAVSNSIEEGLSNIDAACENGIDNDTFYEWIRKAKKYADKPLSRLTQHQRLCRKFKEETDKAKLKRKKFRISKLQDLDNPTGLIFLLKQEHPTEFNKEPFLIANFDKIKSYMESEYTESEIQAIREAIFKAEDRHQAEIQYAEDALFSDDDEGDNEGTETGKV